MPHVDDALLVAYADDALPPSERADVEAHLASCAECRARVEEERGLAQRAAAVLGLGALPENSDMPSFEEILRRSEAAGTIAPAAARVPQRHGRRAWPPLAWAAMLIVALGAGWIARVLLFSPELNAPVEPTQAEASAGRDAASSEAAEASGARAAPAAAEATLDADGAQRTDGSLRSTADDATQGPDAPARRAETQASQALPGAAPAAPPPATPQQRASESAAAASGAPARAAAVAAPIAQAADTGAPVAEARIAEMPPPPAEKAALEALTVASIGPGAVAIDAGSASWRGVDLGGVAGRGAQVPGIAGAPIELVWLGAAEAPWRARVVQRIAGAAVEIVAWRTLADNVSGMSGTLDDGRSYLFTTSGGEPVLLRSTLALERLRELLPQLEPMP